MTDPLVTPPAIDVAPARSSAWEDVLDIFYAPRAVFERRRDGKYLVPILVLCVATVAVYFLSQQMNDALRDVELARTFREQGLKPEQISQATAAAAKFSGLAVYILPVFMAIGAWISGLMTMLLGNMMGAKLNFAQGTTIAVLASMPELLGRLLVGLQGLFLDTTTAAHRYSFSINASRLMSADTNKWLLKFGALVDPFVIWGLVLTGIGAYVIGRMEREKAAVLAIMIGIVGTLLFR